MFLAMKLVFLQFITGGICAPGQITKVANRIGWYGGFKPRALVLLIGATYGYIILNKELRV